MGEEGQSGVVREVFWSQLSLFGLIYRVMVQYKWSFRFLWLAGWFLGVLTVGCAQTGLLIDASPAHFNSQSVQEIRAHYFSSSTRFRPEQGALLKVDIRLDKSGVRTLEGMDIRSSGEVTCKFLIQNLLTEQSSCFTVAVQLSGNHAKMTIEERVLESLIRREDWCDSLTQNLQLVYDPGVQGCQELVSFLDAEEEGSWSTSLIQVYRFKKTFTECAELSAAMLEEKLQEIDQQLCDQLIYEATLLYDTGTMSNVNAAVRKLIRIPPNSPCREKALSLSEQYGKNRRITVQGKEELQAYREVTLVNNVDAWLELLID